MTVVALSTHTTVNLSFRCLLETFPLADLLTPPLNIRQSIIQLFKFPNLVEKSQIRQMIYIRNCERITPNILLFTEDIIIDLDHFGNLLTSLSNDFLIRYVIRIGIPNSVTLERVLGGGTFGRLILGVTW